MNRKKHNYSLIDMRHRYHHRRDRMQAARALGYDTISEAIIKTYRKTKSAQKTGRLNGDLTSEAICRFLRKVKEPIIYDKSRGARPRVL